MKIIDAHAHAFPDELAERALSFLENESGVKATHNGTTAGLLRNMDNAGIEKSVVLSIATKPSQVQKINEWAVKMTNKYSDRLLFSGSVHPDSTVEEIKQNIKFLYDNNIKVIKIHPEYQYICPINKKMDTLYKTLIDYDMTVFFHAGRDIAYVGSRSNPKIFLKLIKKYPALKIVAAHFGSWLLWEDVYNYLAGEHIYFDISYTLGYINENLFFKIFERHNKDLILFGTDSPWENEKECISKFLKLAVDEKNTAKILFENANKLFF